VYNHFWIQILTLETCHPNTLHLRKQQWEDTWLFIEVKRGPRAKQCGKHLFRRLQSILRVTNPATVMSELAPLRCGNMCYETDAGLPLLDRRSSIRTNFCWEPGKSTANSVSTLPRSLRRGLMCFMLNTKLSFLITSSTWWLASEIQKYWCMKMSRF
jgi:hypothetical protein